MSVCSLHQLLWTAAFGALCACEPIAGGALSDTSRDIDDTNEEAGEDVGGDIEGEAHLGAPDAAPELDAVTEFDAPPDEARSLRSDAPPTPDAVVEDITTISFSGGATCEGAFVLPEGRDVQIRVLADALTVALPRCTRTGDWAGVEPGPGVLLRARVAPGQTIVVTPSNEDHSAGADAGPFTQRVHFHADCVSECIGWGGVSARWSNPDATARVVYISMSAVHWGYSGFVVRYRNTRPSQSCGTAPMLTPGTPLRGEDTSLRSAGTGCGWIRAALWYRVTVPEGQVLTLWVNPARVASEYRRVFSIHSQLMPACGAETCVAQGHAVWESDGLSARWVLHPLEWFNPGPGAREVVAQVDTGGNFPVFYEVLAQLSLPRR